MDHRYERGKTALPQHALQDLLYLSPHTERKDNLPHSKLLALSDDSYESVGCCSGI